MLFGRKPKRLKLFGERREIVESRSQVRELCFHTSPSVDQLWIIGRARLDLLDRVDEVRDEDCLLDHRAMEASLRR
jgi:hypothetical protein